MRVVLLMPRMNAAAELAMNQILRQKDIDVVGVIWSDNSMMSKRYWKYLFYGVKRWGVFYAFLVGLFYNLHLIGLFILGLVWWRRNRKWWSAKHLIKKHGLKEYDTEDINHPETLEVFASWKPDVVVSLYFDQILKKEAIAIATTKIINMHPGPLPSYKGLWPHFWLLYNKAKKGGVTVHELTEEVDAGDVLAVREYPIEKKETKFSLMLKSAQHGGELVVEVLRKIRDGQPLEPLKVQGKPKYYRLPKKKHIRAFFARKRSLFDVHTAVREFDRLG